jgi:hypothetical protein
MALELDRLKNLLTWLHEFFAQVTFTTCWMIFSLFGFLMPSAFAHMMAEGSPNEKVIAGIIGHFIGLLLLLYWVILSSKLLLLNQDINSSKRWLLSGMALILLSQMGLKMRGFLMAFAGCTILLTLVFVVVAISRFVRKSKSGGQQGIAN